MSTCSRKFASAPLGFFDGFVFHDVGFALPPAPLGPAVEVLQAYPDCAASQLVLTAAQPWSPENHALNPAAARAKAAALLPSCAHVLKRRCRCTQDSGLAKHVTVALLSCLVARNS